MTRLSFLALAFAAFTGCASDGGSSVDIATTPLAGTVGGQPWTFKTGNTNFFLSEGEDDYFATLYAEEFEACGFEPTGVPHLIVSIPKAPGDYDMGLMLNMTFVVGDENLIGFDGRIVVETSDATRVTGGLYGSYDGDNEVNGTFDVTVCPDT